MLGFWRTAAFVMAAWVAAPAPAVQLAYEPVGLGWSAHEVERANATAARRLEERAARAAGLGCRDHCERLQRIFERLLPEARVQTRRSVTLPWSLLVLRLPDVDAMAMPGGQIVISETFIDQRQLSDEALAFVLAHEMAHVILEHERQALSFARLLLPRQVERSVADMYAEMDFDFSLLRAMEVVVQQGEVEADELGLLLASAAGFAADRQLGFVEQECAAARGARAALRTHPPACERMRTLQGLLPLARLQRSVQGQR